MRIRLIVFMASLLAVPLSAANANGAQADATSAPWTDPSNGRVGYRDVGGQCPEERLPRRSTKDEIVASWLETRRLGVISGIAACRRQAGLDVGAEQYIGGNVTLTFVGIRDRKPGYPRADWFGEPFAIQSAVLETQPIQEAPCGMQRPTSKSCESFTATVENRLVDGTTYQERVTFLLERIKGKVRWRGIGGDILTDPYGAGTFVNYSRLRAGSCFSLFDESAAGPPDATTLGTEVPIVIPCDQPHTWEVFAAIPLAGMERGLRYLGFDELQAPGRTLCRNASAGVAAPKFHFFVPTRTEWKNGQRNVVCMVPAS